MVDAKEVLMDVLLIFKVLILALIANIVVLIKLLIPAKYLNKDITGQVVLLTGAAGGIGRLMAQKLLNLGCILVCVDMDAKELKKLEERLKKSINNQSGRVFTYTTDISSFDEIKSLANKVRAEVGHVKILINNAGIMNQGKLFTELSDKEISKIFDVNALAPMWLCKEFLPNMLESKQGHIVNISSICGIIGGYKIVDYCSTKFALTGFSESLRIELAVTHPDCNVVVSSVHPFHIKTNLFNGCEFPRLKWLNLSIEPEHVANDVVNGLLANKEFICVPKFVTCFFIFTKYFFSTRAAQVLQDNLELSGAMDKYKPKRN